jgi:NADH dehydrogenase
VEVRKAFPDATILKPTWIFGVEDRLLRLFGKVVASPLPVLLMKPETKFQPVYVRDVASAVMAVLSDESTVGKDFELGGPHIYSYGNFVDYVLEQTRHQERGVFTITSDRPKLQE